MTGLQRIEYFELLPRNQTIISVIQENGQSRIIFHHDDARPYTSLVPRQKLLTLGYGSDVTSTLLPQLSAIALSSI